jgi:TonB family protein
MKPGPLLIDTSRKLKPAAAAVPTLVVALEPWYRVFFRNLRDLLWPQRKPPLVLVSRPGSFWEDVFVPSRLPWGRFAQSVVAHMAVAAGLWEWMWLAPALWPQRPQLVQRNVFHASDVVYYDASEYLAPLNTGESQAQLAMKGDPEHAQQPIISVPPEADNRKQTVVTPPKLKLDRDVPLPNVVAWARAKAVIPAAAMTASPSELKLPALAASVVAPAPDVNTAMKQAPALSDPVVAPAPELNAAISGREVRAPQPAIVEPPREVEDAVSRRLTDVSIGHAQVVAPAPQLPMGEQRALASMPMGSSSAAVVPPPPSVQGSGGSSEGRLIALNLHPMAAAGPVDVPAGNRRGTFAATPEGKAGAAGTPDIRSDSHHAVAGSLGDGHGGAGTAGSGGSTNGAPPGLFVGASPKPGSAQAGAKAKAFDDPPLLANATPPRVSAVSTRAANLPANAESEVERKLFAGRKSYSMILNVPNLNSAGGSWVMHFVELKDAEKQGELVAPVATQEVDPGYPLELMRQNVQGTVILSAVIYSDGSVRDIRILRGVDDRLDQYASSALSRWRFRPATRNGDPIALQTVVMIPFHPMKKAGF